MLNTVLTLIKSLVSKEAARLVAVGSAVAVAGALKLAELAGVTLDAAAIAAVATLAGVIATELIRRFVYSEATVTEMLAD